VVLGYQLEDGEMKPELNGRCDAAAAAARSFPDSILITTGGATGANNPEGHTEAGLMKDYLIEQHGIDAGRIFAETEAMTTLENAVNTFAILKDRGIDTITLVTSSYHQRRANLLYETLAEILRRTEGFSVTVSGNYGCEAQTSEVLEQYDARIAAMQLDEILTRFMPEE
jgi:vancomycin permeability regulator SanA